ncbi:hypothetical protein BC943DRAFT_359861 [Umbelopsis sp. AD052]|nr:hypothetical protein BC943DRAFT_359861 [Umbelopsis sp. AD052]
MSERSAEKTLYEKSTVKVQGNNSTQPVTNITLAEMSSGGPIGTPNSNTERFATNVQAAMSEKENQPAYKDCLPCKLTGAAAFTGIGGYALNEARKIHRIPSKQGTAIGFGVTGVLFISAGLYRLII